MAYDDDDRSVQDSEPTYLATLTFPTGVARYNNSDIAITTDVGAGSVTFDPAQLGVGNLAIKPSNESREFLVTLRLDDPIVEAYKAGGPPPRELRVEVWRHQRISNQVKKEWRGFVAALSLNPKEQTGTFHVPCITDDMFDQLIPTISLTRTCNAFLYDNRCRVNKASFTVTTTISNISADGKTITVASNGGNGAPYFDYGLLEHVSSTEQRSIVEQPAVLTETGMVINLPLRNAQVGDSVKISAGCTRLIDMCQVKFNNVLNFRGHPRAPLSNPFLVGTTGVKKIP